MKDRLCECCEPGDAKKVSNMSQDHWVSRFLLKSFTADGRLCVYDKEKRERIKRPTKKVCCEEGFTTFSSDQIPSCIGGRDLESELSRWERRLSQIIAKLIKGRSIDVIDKESFFELIRFAVWLYLCNPANRQMFRRVR